MGLTYGSHWPAFIMLDVFEYELSLEYYVGLEIYIYTCGCTFCLKFRKRIEMQWKREAS